MAHVAFILGTRLSVPPVVLEPAWMGTMGRISKSGADLHGDWGIWHGAGWNFAVYGLIQGVIIFYEMKTTAFHRRLKAQLGSRLYATLSVVRTYLLFAVSLIFFRASSMAEAFHYISHLSFGVHYSWKEMNIGMPDHNSIVAGSALVLILVYEYFMSKHDLLEAFGRQPAAVRWSIYYLLAIILFTLGQFNSDSFIYLQF